MRPVIIVFAKAPAAGRVKTRLVPPLTPAEASRLYSAFVMDTVESLESLTGFDIELHTDMYTDAWRDLAVPRKLQGEGDLGLKMLKALAAALAEGRPTAAIVGSDAPTLPPDYVLGILEAPSDVSFGPAEDGGYYAIAARRTDARMFDGVRWSSPHALADTLVACRNVDLTTALGPAWFDVDTVSDLERLVMGKVRRHTAAALVRDTLRMPSQCA